MTTSVQAFSNNHARSASKSRTFVANRRTSSAGFRWTGPIRMQTSKNFLPTSIPAHRSTLTSSMTLSLRREANAFFIRLASRALLAPIGGSFASARPLYLTGFSPKTTDGLLSSSPNLVAFKPFSSRFSFSSSEVARGAMNLYLAKNALIVFATRFVISRPDNSRDSSFIARRNCPPSVGVAGFTKNYWRPCLLVQHTYTCLHYLRGEKPANRSKPNERLTLFRLRRRDTLVRRVGPTILHLVYKGNYVAKIPVG